MSPIIIPVVNLLMKSMEDYQEQSGKETFLYLPILGWLLFFGEFLERISGGISRKKKIGQVFDRIAEQMIENLSWKTIRWIDAKILEGILQRNTRFFCKNFWKFLEEWLENFWTNSLKDFLTFSWVISEQLFDEFLQQFKKNILKEPLDEYETMTIEKNLSNIPWKNGRRNLCEKLLEES